MLQKNIGGNVVKGLQEFINPYKLPKFRKDVPLQMLEINGLQAFDQGMYHNNHYENLMKSVLSTHVRKSIAKQEYSFWRQYVKDRSLELPENFRISDQTMFQLKESFEVACDRNSQNLQVSKLPKMHFDHMKMYKFTVPMDNRCIVQMIHLHMGYLLRMPRPITFNELIDLYKMKTLASYEKSLGQELLFQELCSLAYWELFDREEQGFMEIKEFTSFMNIFKFNLESNAKSVKQEFSFAANLTQGIIQFQTISKEKYFLKNLLQGGISIDTYSQSVIYEVFKKQNIKHKQNQNLLNMGTYTIIDNM